MDAEHRNDIPLPEWEAPNEQIGVEDDIEDQNPTIYGNRVAHARNPNSEQQALQFRARHIQMMALGNSPTSDAD